jgi:hypothetical protein
MRYCFPDIGSFAVNVDFLAFTFSISTKGKRLHRSRYYLAVLRQPLYVLPLDLDAAYSAIYYACSSSHLVATCAITALAIGRARSSKTTLGLWSRFLSRPSGLHPIKNITEGMVRAT